MVVFVLVTSGIKKYLLLSLKQKYTYVICLGTVKATLCYLWVFLMCVCV